MGLGKKAGVSERSMPACVMPQLRATHDAASAQAQRGARLLSFQRKDKHWRENDR